MANKAASIAKKYRLFLEICLFLWITIWLLLWLSKTTAQGMNYFTGNFSQPVRSLALAVDYWLNINFWSLF